MKVLVVLAGLILAFSCEAYAAATGATITSDELELQNNGDLTIFTGHVVLKQAAYQIKSDRMVRTKATGIVDSTGHVVGTWVSLKNEKIRCNIGRAILCLRFLYPPPRRYLRRRILQNILSF